MVGREEETARLKLLLTTKESEFLTVVGRRRVGKTYLIRETYKNELIFELTGIQNASTEEQLSNFHFALRQYFKNFDTDRPKAKNWIEAFQLLIEELKRSKSKKKKVLFIDELPWLATARSGFLKGLSFFWNSWASKANIILATCGSAASWMIQKVILNKGGLHNRVTAQLTLEPFTLKESLTYLKSRGVKLDRYQMAQLYMVIGGIPYYLKQVPPGKSVPQIVSTLLFSKTALLRNEFDNLYQSLFSNYQKYIDIVEACYSKWKGITHSELSQLTGFPTGGSLTRMVHELEVSGFLHLSQPYGKRRKDILIRLVDEFSIFYLKYKKGTRSSNWSTISKTQSFKSWQGFAFENLCLKHIHQIKTALGISGVATSPYSLVQKGKGKTKGTQIDIIIDRNDEVINICEAKFYNSPFTIDKAYAEILQHKKDVLQSKLPLSKVPHLTMITTYGIKENKYSGMVDSSITLKELF